MVGTQSQYGASAPCRISYQKQGRTIEEPAQLVNISNDGARILASNPLAAGVELTLTVDGFAMTPAPLVVTQNVGNHGAGYELLLALRGAVWPYQVFSALLTMSYSAPEQAPTPTPLKELGLTMPCTVRDVEEAYYRKVRTAHPDRGGNVETFVRLRSAYVEALKLLRG